ncbi:DUF3037 domain-containing protein [Chitinophaga vietnamensis]|uniref:DUF3037 domain-containing protein n=1 Tax=Chitinophaga vietnamensis TaxID=2593957 RepID=UPI001178CA9B|nr:DUF3037 domain-containing protein [Chitinophaga vietnamensis]
MQEKHLFEYAVIRIVPRVEREEFLNVGVILYSRQQRFLQTLITLDEARLRAFSAAADIAEIKSYLHAFEQIAAGNYAYGPIAQLDAAARFRWLTATRSTVIQTSKVHPGFCGDTQAALQKLHAEQVL